MALPPPPPQHWSPQQSGWPPAGQPAPPGYGPQPGPQGGGPYGGWPAQQPFQPSARRSGCGGVMAVLAIVGFLVIVGGGAVIAYQAGLFGGGDPEQVVADYFAASQQGDCGETINLVTEATWRAGGVSSTEQAVADCEANLAQFGTPPDVQLDSTNLASETGDVAVVAVTFTITLPAELGGSPVTDTVDYNLRKEGRQWRIDAASGIAGINPGAVGSIGSSELSGIPGATGEPGATGIPDAGAVSTVGMDHTEIVSLFYEALVQEDCATMGALTNDSFWYSAAGEPLPLGLDPVTLCQETLAAGIVRTDLTFLNDGEFNEFPDGVYVMRSFGSEPVQAVRFSVMPPEAAPDGGAVIWNAALGECAPEVTDQQDCTWSLELVLG